MSASSAHAVARLLERGATWPLLPAWMAMAGAVAWRTCAFERGWKRVHTLPVPVISVGNLVAGGSGKTPLVARLVAECQAIGRHPAVLARGYGGDAAGNDEAAELAAATGVAVVCDPDRVAGGRRAIADGADCLILDDGFQHRRLGRCCDLVCIDCTRPWGRRDGRRGALLPLGLLRETPAALTRAQLAVLTRCDQAPPQRVAAVRRACRQRGLRVVHSHHAASAWRSLATGNDRDPAELAGQRVVACAGIAQPDRFRATLAAYGAQVVATCAFADHHRYSPRDLDAVTATAQRHGAQVVCTGKDAVKIPSSFPGLDWWSALLVGLAMPEHDAEALRATVRAALAPGDADAA